MRRGLGTPGVGGGWGLSASLYGLGKILAFTGVRTPDRPARSESLYRLLHRGRFF